MNAEAVDPLKVSGPASNVPDRRLRVVAGAQDDGAQVATMLDAATIRVVLPEGEVPWRLQVLALTLTDLLSRLFPRIAVDCDPTMAAHPDLPPGPPVLRERLAATARHGGLSELPADPTAADVTVYIGAETDATSADPRVVADGGGWVSYIGTEPSALAEGDWGERIPIGPLLAACRAAAQVTGLVLPRGDVPARVPASVYSDALGYLADERPIDTTPVHSLPVLDAVLVGAGSIGGAAAYTFAHTPALTGTLVVADPQSLESKNLDRALLATAALAQAEEPKATVAHDSLAHLENLTTTAFTGTLQEWVASRPVTAALPLVLAAVDTRDARRSIQDCLPLEVINAACNPVEVHLSSHRTDDGPCMCCLHMEEVLDTATVRVRLIKASTGLNEPMINHYLASEQPMPPQLLRWIEQFRGLPVDALAAYEGRTLEELRVGALLYGATPVSTGTGTVAVAAPYITALAGVLLAGEALKAATPELHEHRLGVHGPAIKYAENPVMGADRAMLTNPPRWTGSECLCRSTRRTRLLAERYRLKGNQTDPPAPPEPQ